MLPSHLQRLVEQATVTLSKLGGRGVLIPGNMILTAAHCVTSTTEGAMVLGDYFIEEVVTAQGTTLKAGPVYVEPVSDVALLAALDNQAFDEEVEGYDAWCEQTTPIPLYAGDFAFDTPVPVAVYTHRGQWTSGTVRQMHYDASSLVCVWDTQIERGTSGSPLLTRDGQIVGVVSNFSDGAPRCDGLTPWPSRALPVWALRQIARATDATAADAHDAAWRAWYGITPLT